MLCCVHVYVVCRCVLYVCIRACVLCVYAVLCVHAELVFAVHMLGKFCTTFSCSIPMHPDPDLELDAVEYNIEEEYEARLDPQAIARLEPGVRSKIDLSFLDRIADTQPQMLAEVGTAR